MAKVVPHVPFDDPEMVYFRDRGLRDLLVLMVKQSLQDLVAATHGKETTYDSREQQYSAEWLRTDGGKQCLQFIMPDVSAETAVARIYENPQAILRALKRVDLGSNEGEGASGSVDYRLSGGAELSDFEPRAEDNFAPS
ncbi:MAG: hypothetical protein K2W33_03740 [Burkholderiales bacterium]|nr:hypothetical protein [Burkholderiales bacterium]